MFVVNFSEMVGNVWDASFYDYERASEVLIQKLDNVKSIDLLNTIETLYNNKLKNGTCIVKFRTKAPFDYVKNWSIVVEHAYPLKAELKVLMEKYNATIDWCCDSCSDLYGVYDSHIEISLNNTTDIVFSNDSVDVDDINSILNS